MKNAIASIQLQVICCNMTIASIRGMLHVELLFTTNLQPQMSKSQAKTAIFLQSLSRAHNSDSLSLNDLVWTEYYDSICITYGAITITLKQEVTHEPNSSSHILNKFHHLNMDGQVIYHRYTTEI